MPRRTAIPYAKALEWIILNDDTDWLAAVYPIPSVTACFLADIYGRTTEEVTVDLRKIEKLSRALSFA